MVPIKMIKRSLNDHYIRHLLMVEAMVKQRTYSRCAQEAALLLGKQIKLGRKQRKWSENNLAERIGISRATLQKIERGEMTCAIGLVFEAAALVGVNLFEQDNQRLATSLDLTQSKIALLPKRIRKQKKAVDDDF
jgi:DNA-binding XRE family transcriptional regulator